MTGEKVKLSKFYKRIRDGVKTADSYSSGFAMEKVIVASYETLTIEQLEKLRYIMNQIIKKKKIKLKIKNESKGKN